MATDNPIHWLEDELMEIMRIVAKEDDDNIIDAIKLHAVRLLVEVDVERYEALYDRWKARHPEAEPLRTIEDAKAAALNGPEGETLELLKVARCPNTTCQDGVIAHQVGEQEWEPEQCQWCFERNALIATGER